MIFKPSNYYHLLVAVRVPRAATITGMWFYYYHFVVVIMDART